MKKKKEGFFSKKNIISLFIVFIMISSVIGAMFGKDGGESIKYNDYSFIRNTNGWMVKIDGQKLSFNFFPAEVENVNISFDVSFLKELVELDTTYDSDDNYTESIALAQFQMQMTFEQISDTFVISGMTGENDFNLPIIKCEDAANYVPVIYFKKSNITNISLNNNCITAEAKSQIDVLRIKDRLMYGILGIIS